MTQASLVLPIVSVAFDAPVSHVIHPKKSDALHLQSVKILAQ